MKTLVVFDSVFGNTEKVARAIGDALGAYGEVEVVRAGDVRPGQLLGVDWLVIGSPTRGFRPTEGVSAFVQGLSGQALAGMRVAAFDTRVALEDIKSPVFRFIVSKGGFAAPWIAKRLGGQANVPAEGFIVQGQEGPLCDGELERAAQWAGQLVQAN
jgi:flavodoxin